MSDEQREIRRKLRILEHAQISGDVGRTCRCFGIGRASFHRGRQACQGKGEAGLRSKRSVPHSPPNKTPAEVEEKVLHLRREYHLGPMRIVWYLARCHGITISDAGVCRILPQRPEPAASRQAYPQGPHQALHQAGSRSPHPDGRQVSFRGKDGQKIRRFQFTAIDDATRIRALKVYERHRQANAIKFVDHVIESFPFRIKEIRTDNGHEFQARFHWHVEDKGIRHAYIKPSSPQLNGKVERSHRSDEQEFPQLPSYKGDVDLEAKLRQWEHLCNLARPHGAHNGKTPYEALRAKL